MVYMLSLSVRCDDRQHNCVLVMLPVTHAFLRDYSIRHALHALAPYSLAALDVSRIAVTIGRANDTPRRVPPAAIRSAIYRPAKPHHIPAAMTIVTYYHKPNRTRKAKPAVAERTELARQFIERTLLLPPK